MTESSEHPNRTLEIALENATEGDPESGRIFFLAFFDAELFIPERYQQYPMSDSPDYPDEFFNALGIQDGERVIVPVFTRVELIEEWCGNELAHRRQSGQRLLEGMPDDWWISLNPASTYGKEFSPWEISELRSGSESIDSVLAENFPENHYDGLRGVPVEPEEYVKLKSALKRYGEKNSLVTRISLLKEPGDEESEEFSESLFAGIELERDVPPEKEKVIEAEVRGIAERELIGDARLKLRVGTPESQILLGLFGNLDPVYVRQEGLRGILKRLFSRAS